MLVVALFLPNLLYQRLPDGVDVLEPVYDAPARWVKDEEVERLSLSGITCVTPVEVLATHMLEIVKKNLARILTTKALRRLLDELENVSDLDRARANKRFLDEFVPDKVPFDVLHAVLRLLLEEQVSIRNLELIIEAIAEIRPQASKPEIICEHVRQRLGFQLTAELRGTDGNVPLIQLAPEWEDIFSAYQVEAERGLDVALPPELFQSVGR